MLEALEPLSLEQFTQELGGSFGSVRNTIVHTLSAECVWLLRWNGENPPGMLAPGGYPDLAAVRHAWTDNEAKMRQFFEPLDEAGLQKVIPYKTFAGLETASPLWQMLQHDTKEHDLFRQIERMLDPPVRSGLHHRTRLWHQARATSRARCKRPPR